jgi:hypothetical protein
MYSSSATRLQIFIYLAAFLASLTIGLKSFILEVYSSATRWQIYIYLAAFLASLTIGLKSVIFEVCSSANRWQIFIYLTAAPCQPHHRTQECHP